MEIEKLQVHGADGLNDGVGMASQNGYIVKDYVTKRVISCGTWPAKGKTK